MRNEPDHGEQRTFLKTTAPSSKSSAPNNFYMAFATPAMRAAVFAAAKRIGLNVLRSPRFSMPPGAARISNPGTPPPTAPKSTPAENGLQRLDHLIADAEQSGIRLILPLVNHWPTSAAWTVTSPGSAPPRAMISIPTKPFAKPTSPT